jgi:hypothetical protein
MMQITVVDKGKSAWKVEADDGRRFVITSGRRDTKVCEEGCADPIVVKRGVPFKTAVRLLQLQLEKRV